VLHLITDAGPHPYFELIGAHADRTRFDVAIASVGPAGALQRDADRMRLPSFALGASERRTYPLAIARLARRIRRERVAVVQTHLVDGSIVGLAAARLARAPLALLTAHHSHEIPVQRKPMLTRVDRLLAGPLSDAIIAPSRQVADVLRAVHGVAPEKVRVVRHGFELDRLDPSVADGARVRRELGLDGRLVITSIGRIYWIKNQEALLRAFATVADAVPDSVLLLVGAGDSAGLRRLGSSLGLSDRVHFAPRRPDVPALLAATDLFVHPALAESFAMVIIEAMAMARPVVSTPVGVAPEVIVDGQNGFLARGSGPSDLAEALKRALSFRARWPQLGAAARRAAMAFPAEAMVREYERIYDELLAGRARRALARIGDSPYHR
jgi:glycosyltransferase involved in cell wall biosynthesis